MRRFNLLMMVTLAATMAMATLADQIFVVESEQTTSIGSAPYGVAAESKDDSGSVVELDLDGDGAADRFSQPHTATNAAMTYLRRLGGGTAFTTLNGKPIQRHVVKGRWIEPTGVSPAMPIPESPLPTDPPHDPSPPQGLTEFDLAGYKIVEVKPSSVRAAGDTDSMIWSDGRDLPFATKIKVSAVAYMNYYAEKHLAGVAGFDKPLCVKLLPGEHKGAVGFNLVSKITGKPAILMAADFTKPTVVDGISLINYTNWVVQGITSRTGLLLNPVTQAGSGLSEDSFDARAVRRFEGVTFTGGVQVHGGIAKLSGVAFYRCRLLDGDQGILAVSTRSYQGEPSVWLEECVIGDAGVSTTRDHGMYLTGCRNVLVRRCVIVGSSGSAAKIDHAHDVTIRDCLIARSGSAASPNANTLSAAGDETRNLVFAGNIVTDMRPGQPAFWIGWSLNGAEFVDNLFVNTVHPDGNGAVFAFVGPFEGDGGATAMRDIRIENNVQWNHSGAFLSIDTNFNRRASGRPWSGIALANNTQGMPPGAYQTWQPRGAMAVWMSSSTNDAQREAGLDGVTIAPSNIWAALQSDKPAVPGVVRDVAVADPTMNIAKLNAALGGTDDAHEFYAVTIRQSPPNVIIDTALRMYRAAYSVRGD